MCVSRITSAGRYIYIVAPFSGDAFIFICAAADHVRDSWTKPIFAIRLPTVVIASLLLQAPHLLCKMQIAHTFPPMHFLAYVQG